MNNRRNYQAMVEFNRALHRELVSRAVNAGIPRGVADKEPNLRPTKDGRWALLSYQAPGKIVAVASEQEWRDMIEWQLPERKACGVPTYLSPTDIDGEYALYSEKGIAVVFKKEYPFPDREPKYRELLGSDVLIVEHWDGTVRLRGELSSGAFVRQCLVRDGVEVVTDKRPTNMEEMRRCHREKFLESHKPMTEVEIGEQG